MGSIALRGAGPVNYALLPAFCLWICGNSLSGFAVLGGLRPPWHTAYRELYNLCATYSEGYSVLWSFNWDICYDIIIICTTLILPTRSLCILSIKVYLFHVLLNRCCCETVTQFNSSF